MKLSVNRLFENKTPIGSARAYSEGWDNQDLSVGDLAAVINRGWAISAQYEGGIRKTHNFKCAGFLAADFDGGLTLTDARNSEFIQQYASLLYTTPSHQLDGIDRFRAVFELPYAIENADVWSNALKGLAHTVGSDMAATDGARLFYGSLGSNPEIMNGLLTSAVLDDLIEQGVIIREQGRISDRRPNVRDGISQRSFKRLTRDLLLKCADGQKRQIRDIRKGLSIHCPFHEDDRPSAFISISGKGDKGVRCSACVRTFWEAPPKLFYDFYKFEKFTRSLVTEVATRGEFYWGFINTPFGRIPAPQRTRPRILDTRFLPGIEIPMGICLVRSPKGSGKTEQIGLIVGNARQNKKSVLMIGHRRTLLRALSKRVGLKCYLDDEDKGHFRRINTSRQSKLKLSARPDYYAVSVDSLFLRLPKPRPYDIVIIDESEQVLSHICADTIENPAPILKILAHYVTNASTIYMLDADLNQVTLGFVSRCRAKRPSDADDGDPSYLQLVVNDYKDTGRICQVFESEFNLQEDLLKSAQQGHKIFVACNSKRRAEMLQKWLWRHVPDLRSLLVTAEDKDTEEVQRFLRNITTEILKYDVVLASPAIGTGIDITFEDGAQKIDVVYGFFNTRINTHYDFDQQLGRVRNPGAVKVWIDDEEDYFETETAVIRRDLVETGKSHVAIKQYEADGTPIFDKRDPLLCLEVDAYTVRRASLNRLKHYFIEHKRHNGWQIEFVEKDEQNEGKIDRESSDVYSYNASLREALLMDARKIDAEI